MNFKAAIFIEPEENTISYIMKGNNNKVKTSYFGQRIANLSDANVNDKCIKLCKLKAEQQAHAIAEKFKDSEANVEFVSIFALVTENDKA